MIWNWLLVCPVTRASLVRQVGCFIHLVVNHPVTNIMVSLQALDIINGKHVLEHIAHQFGIDIKHYHADNGIFTCKDWERNCVAKSQHTTFLGVGAHHQNGVAEHHIQTLTQWACVMMIHAHLYWPEGVDQYLWPLAL
eukprot:4607952-Ditylum_brightwellii.AAC.1